MSDFLKSFDLFKKKAEKACKLVLQISALDLQEVVMKDTPVKTGRLKSNWRLKVGTPEETALYEQADYKDNKQQEPDTLSLDEDDFYGIF